MIQQIVDICKKGAELNYSAKYRRGNVIYPPETGRIIITGDLHGHCRNFAKIVAYADLTHNPQTHIVLQEILHGGPEDGLGGCLAFELLFEVVRFQLQFPDQVHLVMGNHDTAIVCNNNVLKSGREMSEPFKAAMMRCFGTEYENIYSVLKHYLISQPLAVKCPNRIWTSHSLPADNFAETFDAEIFQKKLEPVDLLRGEPVYLLTWGRRHSKKALEKFAELLDTDIFILGHQPQETGWAHAEKNLIILASDHNHGCLISFDPAKSYDIEELISCIVPLASIE